ncbi:MAG: nicotinate-nucleotide adenylyltransferase [Gammaproteobacteria bacterium]|nr:nicotinate-nucleotide adenylyltransferase [Gammaproteobacteria bacterium]
MIGIFGGTFDPVHFGHLRPALDVKQALGLDEMRMIPAFQPPHRAQPVANPGQRLTMLRAAVGGEPDLQVDNREMLREGESFMVDTLASLRNESGDEPLCLILGADAFLKLDEWHHWQEIPELAHIVVTHRPGWQLDMNVASPELQALWRERQVTDGARLAASQAGRIILQAVTPLEISATQVRALVAAGKSPRYLLPDAVWNLIRMHGLYGFSAINDAKNNPVKTKMGNNRVLRVNTGTNIQDKQNEGR